MEAIHSPGQPGAAPAGLPDSDWAQAHVFPVPEAAKGSWCVIRTVPGPAGANLRHMLAFRTAEGDGAGARPFFRRVRRGSTAFYRTVAYVPADAETYHLYLFSPDPGITANALRFQRVSRAVSALLLMAARPSSVPRFARLLAGGELRRLRTALNSLAGAVTTPSDYGEWIELFDRWPVEPPAGAADRAPVSALVFAREADGAALAATLGSLRAQGVDTRFTVLTGAGSAGWREAAASLPGEYVAVLQAGEVLPPHAAWFVGAEMRRLGGPVLALADADRLDAAGHRVDPAFRPEPSHLTMLSGTQSWGAWFVRRDVLAQSGNGDDPGWAEVLRLSVWLDLHEAGRGGGVRLPVVLTHRRPDAEMAPGAALAGPVNAHLRRTGLPLAAEPGFPLVLRQRDAPPVPVSILVPSALRTPLVLRCILSVLADMAGQEIELVVGVSQPGPLDAVQAAAAARIEADGRARVIHLPNPSFNFSAVCNALAAGTRHSAILLLNDDVSVTEPNWLRAMTAFLADPAIDLVGARLLYPDGTVQHGGVLVGLAGLCDHAHRNLPSTAPGYESRAVIAQEMSAVTAACLLVRRTAYDALNGLDETLPSAFNDVDFCLRARERGFGVAYAPEATLIHHEMQTYGSHYSGDRAPFETMEINRMQRRWAGLVRNDPFHSPNLDLGTGREWQLAFPPRRPRRFEL